MPTSPKSPAPHSRLPSTPTSSKRAPQRLKLTPKRQLQTPKRLPSTPQQPTKPMTPRRNIQTTPRISRRKTKDDGAPLKTPKRNNDVDDDYIVSKKRKVRNPPARVPSNTLPVAKSAQRNVSKKTPSVQKQDIITSSGSQKKPDEKKTRKPELNVGKSKKEQVKKSSGTDGDGFKSQDVEPSPKAPSSAKKVASAPAAQNSTVKKSNSKKLFQSSKQLDVSDEPKVSVEKSGEKICSTRDEEETPKKRKSKKKRPASGKFDLPTENHDGSERSSAKRSKKGVQIENKATVQSPKITVNESMTESKLQLLESSPLNRLIAESDRKAAAAEVAAQKNVATGSGKKGGELGSSDSFVPVDRSTADTDRADERKAPATVVGKKEDRKKKGKSKEGRKGGSVLDKDNPEGTTKRGVMYLGHIPHGFYEKEMRSYFSQFGSVTKLKLGRSKKTGGSRGYAFLEFADPAVASIAAEATDGYLMHGQSLVAKVVPDDKVHPETFKGTDKKFKKIPWSSIERRKMIARAKDPLKLALRSRRVKKVTKNRMKQLSKKGIKYDFPGVSA